MLFILKGVCIGSSPPLRMGPGKTFFVFNVKYKWSFTVFPSAVAGQSRLPLPAESPACSLPGVEETLAVVPAAASPRGPGSELSQVPHAAPLRTQPRVSGPGLLPMQPFVSYLSLLVPSAQVLPGFSTVGSLSSSAQKRQPVFPLGKHLPICVQVLRELPWFYVLSPSRAAVSCFKAAH